MSRAEDTAKRVFDICTIMATMFDTDTMHRVREMEAGPDYLVLISTVGVSVHVDTICNRLRETPFEFLEDVNVSWREEDNEDDSVHTVHLGARRQMLCSNGHCWYIAFTLFLDIPNYFPDGKRRAAFIEKHKLQCPKCGSDHIMAANEGPDPDE